MTFAFVLFAFVLYDVNSCFFFSRGCYSHSFRQHA